jgi:hypothetical protein
VTRCKAPNAVGGRSNSMHTSSPSQRLERRASSHTRWAVYENHDLGHWALGHLQFLAVGPQNTFKTAPTRLPDAHGEINWRYVHVGYVDLVSGEIVER